MSDTKATVDASTVSGTPVPEVVTIQQVPATAADVNAAVKDTTTRRVARTALQLVAAGLVLLILSGAFTDIIDWLNGIVPFETRALVTGTWILVVVAAQNLAEDSGFIPPILKTKANVRHDTL